jgi:hypothetical protein
MLWMGVGMAAWSVLASAQSIYTCVDAKGRKITSDRPIPECVDREQRELNPSGSVRRSVGPTLSAAELASQEENHRKVVAENIRRNEDKRRDKVLLARYPDKAAHDRVRAESLVQIAEVIRTARQQIEDLRRQRRQIDVEMEFYKGNPAKAPATLRRQLEDNIASIDVQQRFIGDQESEKNRVNARFDEELARLNPMWQVSASAAR